MKIWPTSTAGWLFTGLALVLLLGWRPDAAARSDRASRFAEWMRRYNANMVDPANNPDPGGWTETWQP